MEKPLLLLNILRRPPAPTPTNCQSYRTCIESCGAPSNCTMTMGPIHRPQFLELLWYIFFKILQV